MIPRDKSPIFRLNLEPISFKLKFNLNFEFLSNNYHMFRTVNFVQDRKRLLWAGSECQIRALTGPK